MFSKAASGLFKNPLPGVRLKTPAYGERTLLTEVRLDRGAVIPAHRHPYEQTGYLVSGSLRFTIEDREVTAGPSPHFSPPALSQHGTD